MVSEQLAQVMPVTGRETCFSAILLYTLFYPRRRSHSRGVVL
jgi:hypothetical protein